MFHRGCLILLILGCFVWGGIFAALDVVIHHLH